MKLDLDKLKYSVISGLIFLLLSLGFIYSYIDKSLFKNSGVFSVNGCPTFFGHILTTLLFFIIIFLIMLMYDRDNISSKLKYSFYGALLFYFLSNKELYQTNSFITGLNLSNRIGCPNNLGLGIHFIVYIVISYLLML